MKFTAVVFALAVAVANAAQALTTSDYKDSISSGFWLIKFYAPWCGHCKRLAPTWDQLATSFDNVDGVAVAKVDCTIEKTVCSNEGVRGYPTLKLFKDGVEVEKYSGGRTMEALSAYLKDKTGKGPAGVAGAAEL